MQTLKVDPTISGVKVGETVERRLGCGEVTMDLKVTAVTKSTIVCGAWTFDKKTGGEIDEDLGWDGFLTGSVIFRKRKAEKEK